MAFSGCDNFFLERDRDIFFDHGCHHFLSPSPPHPRRWSPKDTTFRQRRIFTTTPSTFFNNFESKNLPTLPPSVIPASYSLRFVSSHCRLAASAFHVLRAKCDLWTSRGGVGPFSLIRHGRRGPALLPSRDHPAWACGCSPTDGEWRPYSSSVSRIIVVPHVFFRRSQIRALL